MPTGQGPDTCTVCSMHAKYTHSAREHRVAQDWIDALLQYVKTDAFVRSDSTMTYAGAIERFDLDVTVRRAGRVLDAVERILVARGWPPEAAGGIAAYVVNSGSGKPGGGWMEVWNMNPEDARQVARDYLREEALGS
jgi:hypothetical protein